MKNHDDDEAYEIIYEKNLLNKANTKILIPMP